LAFNIGILEDLNLSLPEILSLIGLVQCVYLCVYIAMRMKSISHAGLPFIYFLVLGSAFFFDMAEQHIGGISDYYYYLQWFAWFSGPPLSVLLVIQFSDINKAPLLREYWVLLLTPLCFMLSITAVDSINACDRLEPCEQLKSLMTVTGLLAGAISLLVIFSKKGLLAKVRKQRLGRERYWLIITLIVVNSMLLMTLMAQLMDYMTAEQGGLARTVLGLGFVYLVSTSLLRLYPTASKSSTPTTTNEDFTEEEIALAQRIEHLLFVDKVYQEAAYSRADLAKECGYSETIVSKVFNAHFQKSFPQVMNEQRVEEAKRLLADTKATVKTISEEVGFNSMPSFNRVFKDMTGHSPSGYRKSLKT
jgi:AraC-like DNA-binding protein